MAALTAPNIPWNDPRNGTIAYPTAREGGGGLTDPGFPEPEIPINYPDPGIPDPGFPEPEVPPGNYSPIPPITYGPDTGFPIDPNTGQNYPDPSGTGGGSGNPFAGLGDTLAGISKDFLAGMGKLWDPKLLMFPAAFASAYKQWQDAEKYRQVAQEAADRSTQTAQGASDYSRGTSQGVADLARGTAGGIADFARGDAQGIADASRGTAAGIAGSARGAAQDALQYGDPFGAANRSYYQDALRMAYEHPEDVLRDPAHMATLKSGLDTVSRQNASKGYLGSGNMEADLAAYTANENAKYLDSYRAGLVPLTGSQFNPASAGNFLMQGEDLAGRSLMQGEDLAGRSLLQGNELAGRSLMQGEDLAGRSLMTGAGQSGGYLMGGAELANNALFKGNDQAIQSQNAALQALMYPFLNSAAGNTINNNATGGQGGGGQGGGGQGGGPGIGPGNPINWSKYVTPPAAMAAEILRVTGGLGGTAASIMRGILSGDYQGISPSTRMFIEDMAKDPTYVNVPFSQVFPSSQPGGGDIPFPYGISDPNSFGGLHQGEPPDPIGNVDVSPITDVTGDPIPDPGFPEPEIPDDWELHLDDVLNWEP